MDNLKRFETFYEVYDDEFEEYLDGARVYLQKYNSEYKKLQNEFPEILDNNSKIESIVYKDDAEISLSPIECRLLCRALELQEKMQNLAEKEIYFKGGMDAYCYFSKVGVIRNN